MVIEAGCIKACLLARVLSPTAAIEFSTREKEKAGQLRGKRTGSCEQWAVA